MEPGFKEFLKRTRDLDSRIVPVWEEIVVDCETPVSLYQKLRPLGHSYLLESVTGGEKVARYSFIGLNPIFILRSWGNKIEIEKKGRTDRMAGNPLKLLEDFLKMYRVEEQENLPRFFGGFVGYWSYDIVRCIEKIPDYTLDDLHLPECYLVLTEIVLIYDHVQRTLRIVVLMEIDKEKPALSYSKAREKIKEIKKLLGDKERKVTFEISPRFKITKHVSLRELYRNNITKEDFTEKVKRAKEYIRSGDIFQVVLSQRWHRAYEGDPFQLYRSLRVLNPSPYMFYLNFPEVQLVGSSPEMLVRVDDDNIFYRPIAGTRQRGNNLQEDRALAGDLKGDPKERAEHIMLVDLGRNDLGRICQYGSVKVEQFMEVENYSHVMHLVSSIQGRLLENKSALDVLAACFPAGTVSGAPKVRAMEIIEELEPNRRGPYAGAVGYLSLNGNMDTCIAIRTLVITGGRAYIQAGAGIVADSVPEKEYEETWNKASALIAALEMSERGEYYASND